MSREPQRAKPKRIRNREQVQKALDLRKNGASYQLIASRLAISKSTAHALVLSGLQELNKDLLETADEVRRLTLERLDAATVKVMGKIGKGDMNAVSKLVLIEERRSKLLGLDAPTKLAQTTPEGEAVEPYDFSKLTDSELKEMIRLYEKMGSSAAVLED
jgi:hypothetical protein